MPDEIYLNVKELGISGLAKKMDSIIKDPLKYNKFFKWHSYYSFHNPEEDNHHDAVCGLCALLNNKTRRAQRASYKYITKWWNEENTDYSNISRSTYSIQDPPDFMPTEVTGKVEFEAFSEQVSVFISSLSTFLFGY